MMSSYVAIKLKTVKSVILNTSHAVFLHDNIDINEELMLTLEQEDDEDLIEVV